MTHTPTEIAAMIKRLEKRQQIESIGGYQRIEFEDEDAIEAAAMLREVAAERDAWRDKWLKLGDQAAKQISAAEAKADRLAAMVEKLRWYAAHYRRCDLLSLRGSCTCGLSDVLKESENG